MKTNTRNNPQYQCRTTSGSSDGLVQLLQKGYMRCYQDYCRPGIVGKPFLKRHRPASLKVLLTMNYRGSVKKKFRILIADRNRHIREFLKRELGASDYRIRLSSSADDVLRVIRRYPRFDLVILDPHLLQLDDPQIFQRFMARMAGTPVILHAVFDYTDCVHLTGPQVSLIEKNGNSIERIKQAILDIQKGALVSGTVGEPSPHATVE